MARYTEVLESVQQLTPVEQAQLLRVLTARLHQAHHPAQHRITELKGLGKGTWEGIDAQDYVRQERDSWDDE